MLYKEMTIQGLNYKVFNPDPIMGASATLVEKDGEGLLIDTQFSKTDAQVIIDYLLENKITLKKVFITHSDPDFYFGLSFIKEAFPTIRSYATSETIKRIKKTAEDKLTVWKDVLKETSPKTVVIPEEENNKLEFKGQTFKLIGRDKTRTVLYNPAAELLVGGISVIADTHVFMADTKTKESQDSWVKDLEVLDELSLTTVIPGHFGEGNLLQKDNISFTLNYIKRFILAEMHTSTSQELIAVMRLAYPTISEGSLELSAKVVTGEMDWA